ncbi:uncharacterized protein LOC141971194 [Athene noctua]|uniref:uncharacterized protein LOC141971194 n=1 Tax=Athene noctua TaxID=126797 RepID=UPI003EBFB330
MGVPRGRGWSSLRGVPGPARERAGPPCAGAGPPWGPTAPRAPADRSILRGRRVPSGAPGSSGEGRSPARPVRDLAVAPRPRRAPGAGSRAGTRRSHVPAPHATEEPPARAPAAAPTPPGLRSAINPLPFSPSPFASPSSRFFFPLLPPTSPLPPALPPAPGPPRGSAPSHCSFKSKGIKSSSEVPGPPCQGAEEEGHGRTTRGDSGNAVSPQDQQFLEGKRNLLLSPNKYALLRQWASEGGDTPRRTLPSWFHTTRCGAAAPQLLLQLLPAPAPAASSQAGTGTEAPGLLRGQQHPPQTPQPLGSATGPQSPRARHHPKRLSRAQRCRMLVPDPGRATGNCLCPVSAQRSCEHLLSVKPLPKTQTATVPPTSKAAESTSGFSSSSSSCSR